MPRDLLAGIRIADLTHFWSGPHCTSLLGAMGAEVIKIESPQRPDGFRLITPINLADDHWYEQAGMWNSVNTNKRGITLELRSEIGRQAFLRIIEKSDVLIDNFSPRVMKNFGFEYEKLKEINPRLVMAQLSCLGQTGPWRDFVGFGTTFDQLGGAAALTGYEDGPPQDIMTVSDLIAGLTAAYAILVALRERERTGFGQYIDMSEVESLATLLGKQIIEYQLTGNIEPRRGNRHPVFAPHNAYPCAGEDNWVAISVTSDAEWAALARAMGRPDYGSDPRFATVLQRKRNEGEIDGLIGDWTRDHDKRAVMELLQSHGVRAGAVLKFAELPQDQQFRGRSMFKKLSREFVGEKLYIQFPLHFSDAVCDQRFASPTLGQHTEEVLRDLVELTPEEIEELPRESFIARPGLGV